MKRTITLAALAAGAGLAAQAANAQVAVGGSIGTTGGSIEAQTQITPVIQLRGGYNYFQYGVDDTFDDIAYDGDLDLTTWGAFVDFRPFSNAFIVTAGAYFGDKSLDLSATPTQNVEIGNQTFTPAQVGTLGLAADLEKTAPFVGIGWDTTFQNPGHRLQVHRRRDVHWLAGREPDLDRRLALERCELPEPVGDRGAEPRRTISSDYEVYPVVQLGVTFSF